MLVVDFIALGVVAVNLCLYGLPVATGTWWIGPRSVGLLGLIPVSWHLAEWYYGVPRALLPSALWLIAIGATLSRTAMAASLVLLALTCLMRVRFRASGARVGVGLFLSAVLVAGILVSYSGPFRERFFGGDQSITVGSLTINAEGRGAIWDAVITSAVESPLIGKGLGSSEVLLYLTFMNEARVDHPHNDYLRLWHDLGLVGLVLFCVAAIGWVVVLGRQWLRAERHGARSAHFELAGILALFGILMAMMTDNVLVYVFVMAPFAIIVGAGLGVSPRDEVGRL